ncbi:hypothetical protein DF200_03140 [Bifidobacterium catulorum]|uniref:PASTA domain-containing protein n=2 Tax=Bifidobacterium catulorum TaxID=1630173 RepID=A0A2U2MTR0_9BIFI|nr:hypothetical protein DF200_03140 [Bifidobacterium catulorum]
MPAEATASAPARRIGRIPLIPCIAAIIAVVLVITGGGLFLTHRAGLWGQRTLPTTEELQSSSGQRLTANIVADQLRDQGVKTKVDKVYSGKKAGEFAGYGNARAGERIDAGRTVTVNESMGPGVPKGTVGRKAADVVTMLRAMNVPVTFRQMPVSDTKRYPTGTVVTTWPTEGSPVADRKTGIQVAVAMTGQADIPYDFIGMDKDTARKTLEANYYRVTMKPRFSSKRYLGKIVDSEPKPGVFRPAGYRVTLYYGVDASQRDAVVGQPIDNNGENLGTAMTNVAGLSGKYCTDGGDCVTLTPDGTSGWGSTLVTDQQLKNGEWTIPDSSEGVMPFEDGLSLCPFSQEDTGCIPNSADSKGYLDGFLINGNTGAMELHSGSGLPYCGTHVFIDENPSYCINGQITSVDDIENYDSKKAVKELVYKPKEFFVVMPVGANLAKLKASGYFSGDSDYHPDDDRPYLIRRDNAAYQPVKAYAADGLHRKPNPYMPGTGRTAFKQAPNEKNVYYLVEDGGALDWDDLKTMRVQPSHASDNAKTESQQAFATLAGTYKYQPSVDGAFTLQLTLKSDGSFTGRGRSIRGWPDGHGGTLPQTDAPFNGRFASAIQNDDGTYTLQCDAKSFTTKVDRKQLGFETCGRFVAYPSGTRAVEALSYDNGNNPQKDTSSSYEAQTGRNRFTDWTIVNKGDGKSDFGVYERQSS